jgi:hypothetical protein
MVTGAWLKYGCRDLENKVDSGLHHYRRGARGDEPENKARYMRVDTSTSIHSPRSSLIFTVPEAAAEPSTAG